MQSTKAKDKLSTIRRVSSTLAQSFIIIEHELFRVPNWIKYCIMILGQLQSVSFVIHPNQNHQTLAGTGWNSLTNILEYIPYIARPQLLITQAIPEYLFIIIDGWLFFFYMSISFLVYKVNGDDPRQKQLTLRERIDQLPGLVQINLRIISITLQSLQTFLLVPSISVCLEAFTITLYNLRSNTDGGSIIMVLSMITLINVLIIIVLRLILTEETVNLTVYGFEKLNLTFSEILVLSLRMVQVAIYCFVEDSNVAFYLQSISVILIGLLTYMNLFVYYTCADRHLQIIQIIVQSLSMLITLSYLSVQIISAKVYDEVTIIVLINFLLIANMLINHLAESEQQAIRSIKQNKDPQQLQYLIVQNLNYNQYNSHTTRGIILQTIVNNIHKTKCDDVQCYCRQTEFIVDDPRRIVYATDNMVQAYNLVLIKRFNKALKTVKNEFERFSLILHFISALSIIGKDIQAFQQIKYLMSRDRQHGIKDKFHSNNNSQQDDSVLYPQNYSFSQTQSDKHRINQSFKSLNEKIRKDLKSLSVPSIEKLNFLQKQKILLLQSQIRNKINKTFLNSVISSKRTSTEEISHAVHLFLDSENSNFLLKEQILRALHSKLQLYSLITSSQEISGYGIFLKTQKLGAKLQHIEQQLNKAYQEFPSQKIQSVLTFFQAEILNNFIQAFKIQSVNTISDENLLKLHKNMTINLFSNKITFLIIDVGENAEALTILQMSNYAHEVFGFPMDEFRCQSSIDFLLPPAIKKYHNFFVNSFLQTGKSKFFRSPELNLSLSNDGFLHALNFFYEINYSVLDQFSFAAFFEQISYTKSYIMVDFNGYVGGVTKNLFEKMGFKGHEIETIRVQDLLYTTSIVCIIPNFRQLVEEAGEQPGTESQQIICNNCEWLFLKKELILRSFSTVGQTISSLSKAKAFDIWGNKSSMNKFTTTMKLNIRYLEGNKYYILEFDDCKLIRNFSTLGTEMAPDIEQDIKPQLQDEPIHSNVNTNSIPNDLSKIMDVDEINLSREEHINQPQGFYFIGMDRDLIKEDVHLGLHQQNAKCLEVSNNKALDIEDVMNILSPNASHSALIHNKHETQLKLNNSNSFNIAALNKPNPMIQGQKFFVDYYSQSHKDDSGQPQQNQERGQRQQHNKVANNLITERRIGNEKASEVTSQSGIRKSPFYKKYDMMTKVLNSKKQPNELFLMNLIMTIAGLLCIVFSIIILGNVQQDLNQFLKEIDILQITNHFLAPEVQFTTERQGISRYDEQLENGEITTEQHAKLVEYLVAQMLSDYDTMKENYVVQLSNIYLQSFFQDRFMEVKQGLNESHIEYNVTVRQALQKLLSDLYQYKLAFMNIIDKQRLREGPGFFFQYSNLIPMIEQFLVLSEDIYLYILDRTDIVSQKWNQLYGIFMGFILLLSLLGWISYKAYLRKLERLMTMFRYIKLDSIEKDKSRFKMLISTLTRDYDLIFRYDFNLPEKEKFIHSSYGRDANFQKTSQKSAVDTSINRSLMKLRLPIWRSIIIFILVIVFFVVLSTLNNFSTETYLSKSRKTFGFFKQISDLGFYLPYMYMTREVLYNISFFPITANDREGLYRILNLAYANADDFTVLIGSQDMSNYLVNSQFETGFDKVKSSNLCNFLNESLRADAEYYCASSFEGILHRGLVSSLITLKSAIWKEQQVNNFTERLKYPYLQIEGEFVTQKVTESLKEELKNNIISITNEQIDLINSLCILIIVYSFAMIIIQYTMLLSYLRSEFTIFKRLIVLMPSSSIMADDQFERMVRLLTVQERIV